LWWWWVVVVVVVVVVVWWVDVLVVLTVVVEVVLVVKVLFLLGLTRVTGGGHARLPVPRAGENTPGVVLVVAGIVVLELPQVVDDV
jgi:hypothetical protein